MSKTEYKTTRKYSCPYCDFRAPRGALVDHVDKKHRDLIPEGYTAARAVYDSINGKDYGICMICGKRVYEWNDKIDRYYNVCQIGDCKKKVREIAVTRHIKVYGKPSLLDEPDQQEKMLAGRRISGTYTFSDGGKFTYTGKYEKNALEFIDKVLEIPSKDIQAPGPVLEYTYKGETHKWITDIYYIPGNLLIEVKDGGSNPNNRSMPVYREKQLAKEEMVTNLGTFNYIRLTDNNFAQLLDVLANMKLESLEDSSKVTIKINEEVGGIPMNKPPEAYIIPCGMNNAFAGYGYSDETMDDIIMSSPDGSVSKLKKKDFMGHYDISHKLIYNNPDSVSKIKAIREAFNSGNINYLTILEILMGRKIRKFEDVLISESFKVYSNNTESKILQMLENGPVVASINKRHNLISVEENVSIYQSRDGYYAITPSDYCLASEYYSSYDKLKESGIVQFMDRVYRNNSPRGGSIDV